MGMKYIIEFELPDNETVLKEIKTDKVNWSIWGYSGQAKAKPILKEQEKEYAKYCHQCGKKMKWND